MNPQFFIDKFPFPIAFSIEPLKAYWNNLIENEDKYISATAKNMVELFVKNPDIANNFNNCDILKQCEDEIGHLLSGIISPFQREHGIFGASIPYHTNMLYSTKAFKKILGETEEEINTAIFGKNNKNLYGPTLHAYSLILKKFYDIDASFDIPEFNIKRFDPESGLVKYYHLNVDMRFVDIKQTGKIPAPGKKDLSQLIDSYHDLSLWQKIIPPDKFLFEGFGMFHIHENTVQQAVTSMQNKLLDKESIINRTKLQKIEKRMKSLLGLPDIKLGIAVFNDDPRSFSLFRNTWITVLSDPEFVCRNYKNTLYEKAAIKGHPMIIGDLNDLKSKSIIETRLVEEGIRSILIVPLHYEEELVGLLEIASPNPDELNTGSLVRIQAILTAFGIAAKRQASDLENQIKAKLQEEFTAIHPTVAWKFKEVATDLLNMELGNIPQQKPSIVFKDVYPLFGVCDIKSSSNERNRAIKADLVEQLKMLSNVIDHIKRVKAMPILDHFQFNLGNDIQSIENELSTGDEVKILTYIKMEVEPVLKHLCRQNENLEGIVDVYFEMLDPELGILYKRRKDFETSVAIINETVGNLLEKREDEAQQMFPHYFEKYRTDGIEHSIYIGESLVQNQEFNSIYLKNLRLWQLKTMCEITQATTLIRPGLPTALETTQMILVHGQPLSIRFREDEKKFDVDGAYNLRYEITKKRIDKAYIKGKDERVVQPGYLAIIYSHQADKDEYSKYIESMIDAGYLEDEVEFFGIEDLQGILGLQGIRVKVKTNNPEFENEHMEKIVNEAHN
nr:GAF domain-containing protein [Bacteroidota bacterium]